MRQETTLMLNILIYKMPKKLPTGMQKAVERLKRTKSKDECLHLAYDVLTKRFTGRKFYFLRKPLELLVTDLDTIWNKKKILNCTVANYLMRTLLIKSGKFKNADIRSRWTLIWGISIHQYLKINIDGRTVNVDLWGASEGLPLGRYAGF
jgi:hypothetical protein